MNHSFMEKLRQELPPFFTRKKVCEILGGYLSVGTLANLQSNGEGPPCIRAGKKVLMHREDFLQWFEARIKAESQEVW